MKHLAAFGHFWWDFVVGDDWLAAAGVVAGLVLTGVLSTWWVLPFVVALVLALTLVRAVRQAAGSRTTK